MLQLDDEQSYSVSFLRVNLFFLLFFPVWFTFYRCVALDLLKTCDFMKTLFRRFEMLPPYSRLTKTLFKTLTEISNC